jgi:hypothetical protein
VKQWIITYSPFLNSWQGLEKVIMEDLRRGIAASDKEIDDALETAFAVEIDGTHLKKVDADYVYRLSPAYVTQILDLIISTATADSLPLDNLRQDDIVKFLASDEERPECIHIVLKTFSGTQVERIPSLQL